MIGLFLKGLAMGAANVVPGVSGGTIALITGIYERLIFAIKSCNLSAVRLLLKGNLQAFWQQVDAGFLAPLLAGVATGIILLAKLVKSLLELHPVLTMAFFFGLILLSVWFVGRSVGRWSAGSIGSLLAGTAIAVGIALMAPASENPSFFYLFLCGVVAICSMILPGLSGSFVLIIMGNYALVIGAIGQFNLSVLVPMALGCVFGLIAFSNLLTLVFKRFHDQTIALMTGFVLGSLAVIWPWKNTLTVLIEREGQAAKEAVIGYEWFLPAVGDTQTLIAIGLMILGGLTIWATERLGDST
ncbi:MAG: DUF368 domain-containing protein [Burkholderiaceae bacterium]